MENTKEEFDKMMQIVNKPVPNLYQLSHEDLIKICSSVFNYGMFATDECYQSEYHGHDFDNTVNEAKQEFIDTELPYLLQNLTK